VCEDSVEWMDRTVLLGVDDEVWW